MNYRDQNPFRPLADYEITRKNGYNGILPTTEFSMPQSIYPGLKNDPTGGMHSHGKMIRDAWVFDILPETEDCAGWTEQRLDALYEQVAKAWEPYGNLPSLLPSDLQEKHMRIFREAMESAKTKGWNADDALNDDK